MFYVVRKSSESVKISKLSLFPRDEKAYLETGRGESENLNALRNFPEALQNFLQGVRKIDKCRNDF
jgi:hypothetical protein